MKKLETERVALYCGDCLCEMEAIQDGVADMVLTDPPYSSGGLFAGDRKASTRKKYTDSDAQGAARFHNFAGTPAKELVGADGAAAAGTHGRQNEIEAWGAPGRVHRLAEPPSHYGRHPVCRLGMARPGGVG